MTYLFKLLLIFGSITLCSVLCIATNNSSILASTTKEKYFGDDQTKPSVNITYHKELANISIYLNSFDTFSAGFKQSTRDGRIRYGKIFISKPDKIRCEYLAPSPMLLLLKENRVIFYDYDLDETSYANSDIESIQLLSRKNLNLKDVNVVEVSKDSHFIEVTIKEHIKQSREILLLTLKFSYPKIELKQITVTTQESDIDLILDKIVYNKTFGKELFIFNRDFLRKNK
ncbi:MAG: outer membrane lipoprotein carrier protein LolA [Rickettsiales bacterium]